MERQTVITRRDKFTVASTEKNSYGDLIVRDTNGLDHKVGVKRARLFDIFQEGAEVQVGYAEYMQKEYIATAEQTGQHDTAKQVAKLPPQKPISPPPQIDEPMVEEARKLGARVISVDNVKNRAVAISYSKDLVCAGKIELDKIITYADKFLNYIENIKIENK